MKVAILIATRKRPEILDKCLKSLQKMTKYQDFFVQVVFDGDSAGYKKLKLSNYKIPVKKNQSIKQIEYIAAINKAYELVKGKADLFVNWSDDTMSTTGWLTKAVNQFKKQFPKGGGIVSMNHYWGDKLCTHGIFDRKFLKGIYGSDNYILFPEFIHYGGDDLLTALAKKKGLIYYDPDIKVIHPTPAETKGNPSIKHKDHDRSLWIKLRAQNK